MKECFVCGQSADIYTSVHKKEPFVDGRNYDVVCFTCYFVPKILDQRYALDGSVSEELDLGYSCENLCSPKELHLSGAADSLKQAKICVDAVSKACSKAKSSKVPKKRPKASWNMA